MARIEGFDTVFQVRISHTADIDSRDLRDLLETGLEDNVEIEGVVGWAVSHVGTTNESIDVQDVIERHKEMK